MEIVSGLNFEISNEEQEFSLRITEKHMDLYNEEDEEDDREYTFGQFNHAASIGPDTYLKITGRQNLILYIDAQIECLKEAKFQIVLGGIK